jgi:hypothetical protein
MELRCTAGVDAQRRRGALAAHRHDGAVHGREHPARRGRVAFARLERWQTAYLPVYALWAWVVVMLFPPVFGFR